jgi:hypothetical protein
MSYFAFGRRAWTSKKGIFSATVDFDQLKLQWTGNRHLLVVVCRCKREVVLFKDPRWQDIDSTYAFSQS